MKTPIPHRFASALALTLGLAAPLPAQQAPTSPPAQPQEQTQEQDQPIVLAPFSVNTDRDRGYTAVDALAGGRTNMPIKLTPVAISSLTRAFIDDVAIQNVREALQWAPNVVAQDVNAGRGFGGQAFQPWSYNFRGVGAGQQGGPGPTRNYFSFFENADSYNIERVEFTRGANGILFGLGTVGGTLSTYTKVPRLDKSFFSPAVVTDNYGSLRFEADYNVVAGPKLAIRANALYDEPRGWRQGDRGQKRALDVAFLYQLTDRTTLRLELEGARNQQTLISSTIADKASGWDGQTASETWGAAPTGAARTVKIAAAGAWGDWLNLFPVYIPGFGSKGLMFWGPWDATRTNYLGGYASTSSLNDPGASINWAPYKGWYPDQIKLPWESTWSSTANVPIRPSRAWSYGRGRGTNDYTDLSAFLNHRFNRNFELLLSFFTYDTETIAKDYEGTGGAAVDINKQLPDGSPNPNFGKSFADFFLSKQTQRRSVDEYRGQLNYTLDGQLFGAPFKQVFAGTASYRRTAIAARQYLGQIANGTGATTPANWVHNMVWGRIYLDRPNQFMDIPEVINGYAVAYVPKADGYWFDFDDKFDLTSYALYSNTRMFDERLSIALGVRRDDYDERLVSLRRGPNLSDDVVNESNGGTTYTAGAVYYFGWLGVFANYSENILPPNAGSQPYLDGSRPAPEQNSGYDYGLRISTRDGRYYASISRYDSKNENRNVENPVPIRGVWQAYNVARGANQDEGFGAVAYSDTQALTASGYEFDITANPTPGLRLQATYSRPRTEITSFYPMARAHYDANVSTWNDQLAQTTDPTRAANLRNAIASLKDALDQAKGGNPQQGQVDYTASVFANYTFRNTALKGWSAGAGASFTGRSYLISAGDFTGYGNATHAVNAVLGYETMIGRAKVRFALNVDNVFDYNDPLILSYHWGYQDQAGRRIPDSYYYQNPRRFRFTARFTF